MVTDSTSLITESTAKEAGRQPTLVVSEIFGPTFQGEGPSAGRRAGFVRLMGCNLSCSWCDTPYTWNGARFDLKREGRRLTAGTIAKRVGRGDPELAVVTGGEPLLHQKQLAWIPMLDAMVARGMKVEIETNGTQMPSQKTIRRVARFNVSPKLGHGGDRADVRFKPDVLRALALTGCAVFKFVVRFPADLAEVEKLVNRAALPNELVWIMPEGTDAATLDNRFAALAPQVVEHGWNLTTRLHVIAYGDKRGV